MKGHPRQRLKVWRADKEKTQHQMARLVGVSQTRYWQIEHGEGQEPSKDEREAVAAALGIKESEIAWPDGAKAQAS